MPDFSKCTHVYVATCRERGSKIGISHRVKTRIGYLRVGHKTTRLEKTWHRPKDARDVEFVAHGLVGKPPVSGREWFDITCAEAIRIVEQAIEKVDSGDYLAPQNSGQALKRRLRAERIDAIYADMRKTMDDLNAMFASGELTEDDIPKWGRDK